MQMVLRGCHFVVYKHVGYDQRDHRVRHFDFYAPCLHAQANTYTCNGTKPSPNRQEAMSTEAHAIFQYFKRHPWKSMYRVKHVRNTSQNKQSIESYIFSGLLSTGFSSRWHNFMPIRLKWSLSRRIDQTMKYQHHDATYSIHQISGAQNPQQRRHQTTNWLPCNSKRHKERIGIKRQGQLHFRRRRPWRRNPFHLKVYITWTPHAAWPSEMSFRLFPIGSQIEFLV